jgi:hypothetical protein
MELILQIHISKQVLYCFAKEVEYKYQLLPEHYTEIENKSYKDPNKPRTRQNYVVYELHGVRMTLYSHTEVLGACVIRPLRTYGYSALFTEANNIIAVSLCVLHA